jgi:hypothetical protein
MVGKVFDVVENRCKESGIDFFTLVDFVGDVFERDRNAPKVFVLVGNDA